jgi:peptidyl-prolyl cis-trans isomerase D
MLSFFRRIINSRVGIVVTFIVLGVIALAFAAGDVSHLSSTFTGGGGNDVATIGSQAVTVAELRQRAGDEVAAARQRNPQADMAGYLASGQLETSLDRMVTSYALAEFGREQGMVVSKRLVDGQIAGIPGLQGPTGKFDEALYRRILAERKLTDAGIRRDIARDTLVQQLTAPTIGAAQIGEQLALPYASLLLEQRAGKVGFVPVAAMPAGPAPTDAEIATWYGRNLQRYRVPERRTIRYALVTPEQVRAQSVPTEAEIAAAYQRDAAKYRATERRTIGQVIVADKAAADALAAKVRGGTSLADAARAAGLEASTLPAQDKAAYAVQTTAAVADAVFAAPRGAVIGPVRGGLGFIVARVDAVEQVAGRSLAQARGEIVAALTTRKTAEALSQLHDRIDDALGNGATFDEAIKDAKLQPQTTPALTAQGTNPDNPGAAADPALVPLATAAFTAEDGDGPQLVQTGKDGGFAIVAVGQITPAAPRPLAAVRNEVVTAFRADRARQAARKIAAAVLAKVNGGMPLAQALAQAGVPLPPVRAIGGTRADVGRQQGAPDPAMVMMFSMAPGTAKLTEAPQGSGWIVVRVDSSTPGDARRNAAILASAKSELGRGMGAEYAEQFARAVRAGVGVKTDAAALKKVRDELAGQGGSDN